MVMVHGAVHNFFIVISRIHRCPHNRMSGARPQHFMPYSLRIVCASFNVPQLLGTLRSNNADFVKYAIAAWGLCRGRRVCGGRNKLRWWDSATR